jgi:hypothetical protein
MTPASPRTDVENIRQLLSTINNAWAKGKPDQIAGILDNCFADDIVFKGPDFQEVCRGKAACIQSYVDFAREATLGECSFAEPSIDVYGETAVATYSWVVRYALKGQDFQDKGFDLFVFSRAGGRWRAIWRAALMSPGS